MKVQENYWDISLNQKKLLDSEYFRIDTFIDSVGKESVYLDAILSKNDQGEYIMINPEWYSEESSKPRMKVLNLEDLNKDIQGVRINSILPEPEEYLELNIEFEAVVYIDENGVEHIIDPKFYQKTNNKKVKIKTLEDTELNKDECYCFNDYFPELVEQSGIMDMHDIIQYGENEIGDEIVLIKGSKKRDNSYDAVINRQLEDSRLNIKGDLFKVKSANQWMNQAKITTAPRKLFSELWHENEICFLFADTNVGKSILAVQIGNSISKGRPIEGFDLEVDKQPVLYFDFELSMKQFESRYAVKNNTSKTFENHYEFDNDFYRIEFNPDAEFPEGITYEEFLIKSIVRSILEKNAKVIIIDNLTYLKGETEQAKDASPLMKELKRLKNQYDLSILVLAHTPKRDPSKPLGKNDLAGSKMLINFCDSCFAVGESQLGSEKRYIKQIKARNTAILYGSENVIECEIQKPHNFLEFTLLDIGLESDHLRRPSKNDNEYRIQEACKLKSQGLSNTEIAKSFGVSEGAVRKWFKKNVQPD